ncbi:hypothetical protein D1007_16430 [Hordeum vulgare]|nr:hypothetical protein D1007_16430 [Hordeum vulgare]
MAGSGSSPHADEPNCGGGGATQQDFHGHSTAASPLSTNPSGQAPRTSVVADEAAASSSACASDKDDEPTERDKNAAEAAVSFLGPQSSSPTGASSPSSSCSDFSGGASTSSSLDAYEQILESSFWWNEYETCDDMRAYFGRVEYEMLLANYCVYREICPDGNCFYRSFIFSYLEQLEASPNEELRLFGVLEPMWEKFQSLHWFDSYSDLHINSQQGGFALEIFATINYVAYLCYKCCCSAYQNWLFQESQNEQKFANILSYLRLITTIEICTKAQTYKPFIDDTDQKLNLVEYCRENVIPMKEEVEHINLFALTSVLQVPLQIVNIYDKRTEPNTLIIYESPDSSVPTVTLLYRPGHYDIIYKK